MLTALELADEQALDQRPRSALLLCPVDQAVSVQGVGTQPDVFEPEIDAVRRAGVAHALEQGFDGSLAAEFVDQEGQVGFSFRRGIRIEEKGAPALADFQIGVFLSKRCHGDVEPAQADEAPRADKVGNDFQR